MAFQSRAATFYANTSYAGLYNASAYVGLNGSDVTSSVVDDSFELTMGRGRWELALALRNTEVTPGHAIEVRDGGAAGRVMFAGRVTSVHTRYRRSVEEASIVDEVLADDRWLLRRYGRYTGSISDASPASALSAVLNAATDGGAMAWSTGTTPSSPNVGFSHVLEDVERILEEMADCLQGVIKIDETNRQVSILTSYTDGHPITLDNTETDFWDLEIRRDRSQSRNLIYAIGGQTTITTNVNPDSTEIGIADAIPFGETAGRAILNGRIFLHTSTDAPITKELSGLSEMEDVYGSAGDTITAIKWAEDTGDQTTMATTLGGSLDGQILHVINAGSQLAEGTVQIRDSDLATYSEELITLRYRTRSRFVHPLKSVTVNVTTPRTLSKTLQIDTVVVTTRGTHRTNDLAFEYHVSCGPARVPLDHLISQVVNKPIVG